MRETARTNFNSEKENQEFCGKKLAG